MSFRPYRSFAFAVVVGLAGGACDKDAPQATVGPATSTNSAAIAPPNTETITYVLDPQTSKVGWTGSKITANHEGAFTQFSGTVVVPGGKAESAKIHIDIDTASLTTQPDKLMGHLKSPDFFDVEKFPKATFDSVAIAPNGVAGATHTITGNLALHGVNKSISFPAVITLTPTKISAKADFSISRKDWNLVYPGMPNDLIKDDVAIHLTIEAPKKGS